MRRAAVEHGYSRVHLHDKNPGFIRRTLTNMFQSSDRPIHLSTNRAHTVKNKFSGPVFDPEGSGYFKTPHLLGKDDAITKRISHSKLEEYRLGKKLGLKIPHTTQLRDAKNLSTKEIAKPKGGSQSRIALSKKDIEAYNPDDLGLRNYKLLHRKLLAAQKAGKMGVNEASVALNHHPGYRQHLAEQAIRNPKKFVRQTKINIDKEYRVHTLHGEPIGSTHGRHWLTFGGKAEAESAARRLLKGVHPKLKNNMMALDVAKDRRGKWHIIETNPGPGSGFLTPTKLVDFRGPQELYKFVTGRYSKPVSTVAGAAVAGGVYAATKKRGEAS
jgi:hypothetical protein